MERCAVCVRGLVQFGNFCNKHEFRTPALCPSSGERKADLHKAGADFTTWNRRQMRVQLSKLTIQKVKNNLEEFSYEGTYESRLKRFPLLRLPTIHYDVLALQRPSYHHFWSREGRRTSPPICMWGKKCLPNITWLCIDYYCYGGYFVLCARFGQRSKNILSSSPKCSLNSLQKLIFPALTFWFQILILYIHIHKRARTHTHTHRRVDNKV